MPRLQPAPTQGQHERDRTDNGGRRMPCGHSARQGNGVAKAWHEANRVHLRPPKIGPKWPSASRLPHLGAQTAGRSGHLNGRHARHRRPEDVSETHGARNLQAPPRSSRGRGSQQRRCFQPHVGKTFDKRRPSSVKPSAHLRVAIVGKKDFSGRLWDPSFSVVAGRHRSDKGRCG